VSEQSPNPRPTDAASLVARLEGVAAYLAQVVSVSDRTPHLRELRLTCPGFTTLAAAPGQDLMVEVPLADGTTVRRRYSICDHDLEAGELSLWLVRHGEGAGDRWAATAAPGDQVDLVGPRGKQPVRHEAARHLFVADHSALAATASMLASTTTGHADVVVEVHDPDDAVDLERQAGVTGTTTYRFHRGHPGSPDRLLEAVAEVEVGSDTHAYVNAELSVMRAVADALAGRGLTAEQRSTKPYWRRGVANAPHGEPIKT